MVSGSDQIKINWQATGVVYLIYLMQIKKKRIPYMSNNDRVISLLVISDYHAFPPKIL